MSFFPDLQRTAMLRLVAKSRKVGWDNLTSGEQAFLEGYTDKRGIRIPTPTKPFTPSERFAQIMGPVFAIAGTILGAGIGGAVIGGTIGTAIGGGVGAFLGGTVNQKIQEDYLKSLASKTAKLAAPAWEFPELGGGGFGGYGGWDLPDTGIEGTRLDDLTFQSSTYGQFIPIVFGRVKTAGNVIWYKELEPEVEVSTEGGVRLTEYKYYATFAAAFALGPRTRRGAIRRVWLDQKLAYDYSTDAAGDIMGEDWTPDCDGASLAEETINPAHLDPEAPGSTSAWLLTTDDVPSLAAMTQDVTIAEAGQYNLRIRARAIGVDNELTVRVGADERVITLPATGDGWATIQWPLDITLTGTVTVEVEHGTVASSQIAIDSWAMSRPTLESEIAAPEEIRLYMGDEDQEPCPIMQAEHSIGADYVPGYKGIVYITIKRLPLEGYRSQVPTVSIEYESGHRTLAEVVEEVCVRAGLAAGEYDVSDLAPVRIRGTLINSETSWAGWLEALKQVYQFDVQKGGGKLVFRRRGGLAPVATLTTGELGVHSPGGSIPPEVPIMVRPWSELPRSVTVSYMDEARDYEGCTQVATRETMQTGNDVTTGTAVVLSADEARQLADIGLYRLWMERVETEISMTPARMALEPGDLVNVPIEGRAVPMLIQAVTVRGGGLVGMRACTWGSVFQSMARGDHGYFKARSSSVAGITTDDAVAPSALSWLDIPLLRDADDGTTPVVYWGAVAGGASWAGAELTASNDSGDTWTHLGTALKSLTAGITTTPLGVGSGYRWDRHSILEVDLDYGSMADATEDAVLDGANLALVGDEVIQFTTADYLGGDTWRLSGLLRGRRGTEWAIDTHAAAGERFVVLDADTIGMVAVPDGSTQDYRAVTLGQVADAATIESHTSTSGPLRPFSPVHFRGVRIMATNDWTLSWTRRTRTGGDWEDLVDADLGETTEEYEVEIRTYAGAVVRTITGLTTPGVTYTEAQQIEDFGYAQIAVRAAVYQMSSAVGRGAGTEGSFTP